jgi:hypothetical protein
MSEGPGIEGSGVIEAGTAPAPADDTGTSNAEYDLVSVLYHALQGAELCRKYASDAGGDQDLAEFFREVREQELGRAARARQLLATRLQGS